MEKFAKNYCTCTLGELSQEQVGHVQHVLNVASIKKRKGLSRNLCQLKFELFNIHRTLFVLFSKLNTLIEHHKVKKF